MLVAVLFSLVPNSMDISELDIDFLSQKLSDDSQSPLFARLADLYLMKNQADEALRLCEAGVKIYPIYASAHVVLGRCHLALNEKAKARTALQRAVQLSPFGQVAKALLAEIPEGATDEVRAIEDEFLAASAPSQNSVVTVSQSPEENPSVENEEPLPHQVIEESADSFTSTESYDKREENSAASLPEKPTSFPMLEEYLQEKLGAEPNSDVISLDEYLDVSTLPAESNHIETIAEQLQNAGRIVPQNDAPSTPVPEISSSEPSPFESNIVTPTLAEIYASQGEYSAAIQAYEILILSKPEERGRFEQRIKELQAKLYESEGLV